LLIFAACSHPTTNNSPDGAAPSPDASPDAAPVAATFSYTPSWAGVQSINVLGGTSTDMTTWTALASMTSSGATWTGTATLTPGTYNYLFSVTGDASAGTRALTLQQQAVDPTQAAFAVCPTAQGEMNTCSQITVPQTGTPTLYAVSGQVDVGANPGANFLVVFEREEPTTHHTFVDRANTAADGSFTFMAAPGNYRFQIQHPEFESKNDSQLQPATLGILRRNVSTSLMLSAAKTLASVDMAYTTYAQLQPQPGTTQQALPTTFTFPTGKTNLDIYAGAKQIGDPYYFATTTSGTSTFASPGMFNTPQATKAGQTMVVAGTQYWWGVEIIRAADSSGLVWTNQSMVFPITWNN
jgi:hypothetical protein